MSRLLSLLYYGVKTYLRHKDVLFWTLAWPILWLLMVAYVFIPTGGVVVVKVAIIDCDHGLTESTWTPPYTVNETVNLTDAIYRVFKESSGVNATYVIDIVSCKCSNASSCRDYARELLVKKGYDIAVLVPENASELYSMWIPVNITVYVKAATPSEEYLGYGYTTPLYNMSIATTIKRIEATSEFVSSKIPSNITVNTTGGYNISYTPRDLVKLFFYGIAFPVNPVIDYVRPKAVSDRPGVIGWTTIGAIGLALMTGLLTAGAGFYAFRREDGYLRRVLSSPVSFRYRLVLDILENLIVSLIISVIIVLVGVAIGARILFNLLNPLHYIAIGFILVAALFAYGLGLLLAPVTKSSKAVGGATGLGLVLVFLTGIWWPPKQLLPAPLKAFAYVFPPSCAFDVVRDIIVWGKSISDTLWNIEVAIIGTIILYIIIAIVYHGRLEKFAEKML